MKFRILIFAIIAVALLWGGVAYNKAFDKRAEIEAEKAMEKSKEEERKLMEGFSKKDIIVGSGEEATRGKVVSVHYVGTLEDGREFDSSYKRGAPFKFRLGAEEVIAGWDIGILGMKVGGKRELIVPPALAYGDQAIGPIPANSTLRFIVELVSIE